MIVYRLVLLILVGGVLPVSSGKGTIDDLLDSIPYKDLEKWILSEVEVLLGGDTPPATIANHHKGAEPVKALLKAKPQTITSAPRVVKKIHSSEKRIPRKRQDWRFFQELKKRGHPVKVSKVSHLRKAVAGFETARAGSKRGARVVPTDMWRPKKTNPWSSRRKLGNSIGRIGPKPLVRRQGMPIRNITPKPAGATRQWNRPPINRVKTGQTRSMAGWSNPRSRMRNFNPQHSAIFRQGLQRLPVTLPPTVKTVQVKATFITPPPRTLSGSAKLNTSVSLSQSESDGKDDPKTQGISESDIRNAEIKWGKIESKTLSGLSNQDDHTKPKRQVRAPKKNPPQPTDECVQIGQFLLHPWDRCQYRVCVFGKGEGLLGQDMPCAPGTSVPSSAYITGKLAAGPLHVCSERARHKCYTPGDKSKQTSSNSREPTPKKAKKDDSSTEGLESPEVRVLPEVEAPQDVVVYPEVREIPRIRAYPDVRAVRRLDVFPDDRDVPKTRYVPRRRKVIEIRELPKDRDVLSPRAVLRRREFREPPQIRILPSRREVLHFRGRSRGRRRMLERRDAPRRRLLPARPEIVEIRQSLRRREPADMRGLLELHEAPGVREVVELRPIPDDREVVELRELRGDREVVEDDRQLVELRDRVDSREVSGPRELFIEYVVPDNDRRSERGDYSDEEDAYPADSTYVRQRVNGSPEPIYSRKEDYARRRAEQRSRRLKNLIKKDNDFNGPTLSRKEKAAQLRRKTIKKDMMHLIRDI